MKTKLFLSALSLIVLLSSCSQLKQLANSIANLKNLQFSLERIESLDLAGVNISKNTSLNDLSTSSILKLTAAAASKNMPISFNLLVKAENPNSTSTGGNNSSMATITDFPFDLFIDNTKTISGNISSNVKVPEAGVTVFPVSVGFEMFDMFGSGGYQKMAKLAMNLAGFKTDQTKLKVIAIPKISTSIGPLNPGKITILNKKLN
ncbi:hypothetical protein OAQ99_02550 [Candidatus Kapabacteria bacterium]|nr:hypothetical protein [Candidatus Kapabacteria bacterium]